MHDRSSHSAKSMRCLVEEGSPSIWGADSDSRAGPTQGQSLLCICAVPLLVLPTPSSTGRLQAELQTQLPRTWPLRQPAAGSHPSTLDLEAVFPAPSKFQHSQKYRSSKGKQVSMRSHSAQVTLSPHSKPCTSGAQGLHRWSCLRLTAPSPSTGPGARGSHRRVRGTSFGNNSESQDTARLHTQCCAPEQ